MPKIDISKYWIQWMNMTKKDLRIHLESLSIEALKKRAKDFDKVQKLKRKSLIIKNIIDESQDLKAISRIGK